MRRAFHAYREAVVIPFRGSPAQNFAQIICLGDAQSLGNLQGNEQSAPAETTKTGGRLGLDNADDTKNLFTRHDGKTRREITLSRGSARGCFALAGARFCRERLAFGIAQGKVFTEKRVRLGGEIPSELDLKYCFVDIRAGEECAFHAIESAIGFSGCRNARDGGRERLAFELDFRREANLGIDFDNIGEPGDFLSRLFVQRLRRRRVRRVGACGPAEASLVHPRADKDSVKQTGAGKALAG